jgi:exosortase
MSLNLAPSRWKPVFAVALLAGAFLLLYDQILMKLVHDWATDDNYSHGLLVVPIVAYLVWQRRGALAASATEPHNGGLAVVAGSLVILAAGVLGSELFLSRISMIGVLAGAALFTGGRPLLKLLLFPLGLLLITIPLPAIVFNQIAFPLQLVASRFGEAALGMAGVPVLREGNLLVLANTTLEVAEACSGMRSLMSLLTVGILIGYFGDPRSSMRILISLATIPIAIVTNAVRVAGTGIAAHYVGARAAEGFLHAFSGWLIFVVALLLVFGVRQALSNWLPAGRREGMPCPEPA